MLSATFFGYIVSLQINPCFILTSNHSIPAAFAATSSAPAKPVTSRAGHDITGCRSANQLILQGAIFIIAQIFLNQTSKQPSLNKTEHLKNIGAAVYWSRARQSPWRELGIAQVLSVRNALYPPAAHRRQD